MGSEGNEEGEEGEEGKVGGKGGWGWFREGFVTCSRYLVAGIAHATLEVYLVTTYVEIFVRC